MTRDEFIKSLKTGKNSRNETHLLGQAGVWSVAAQLALRGIVPAFPGVDHGYDLLLDNGLRLQIKTATLRLYGGDKRYLAYCFDCRGKKWNPEKRQVWPTKHKDYANRADFYVLWGVDEDRFWIMPTNKVKGNIWFPRRDQLHPNRIPGGAMANYQKAIDRLERTEDRWDLLNTDQVAAELIESVAVEKEN
jgi:hypothetical protein